MEIEGLFHTLIPYSRTQVLTLAIMIKIPSVPEQHPCNPNAEETKTSRSLRPDSQALWSGCGMTTCLRRVK